MILDLKKLYIFFSILFLLNFIIPYNNLIYSIIIFLIFIIGFEKHKIYTYHYLYFLISCLLYILTLIRGESDLGTITFVLLTPFILTKKNNYSKNYTSILIYKYLTLLIVSVILIFGLTNFSLNLSTTRKITEFINILLTFKNESTINVTDITTYLYIGIPFILHKKKSNTILLLFFISSFFLNKSLAVEITFLYLIYYNLSFKNLKIISYIYILIILLIPYFVSLIKYADQELIQVIDFALNYRMTIWSEASINIGKNLFIGLGETPLKVLTPFSNENSYSEMSFHSGYIRLLYQNGIIFYFLSLITLHFSIIKNIKKDSWKNKNLLIFYLGFLTYLFTDGSIFFGYTYYIIFIIPFMLLNYKENEYTFCSS